MTEFAGGIVTGLLRVDVAPLRNVKVMLKYVPVLLRKTQNALESLAHEIPAGNVIPAKADVVILK